MELIKYIEIENRFNQMKESKYSNEEKILILHRDIVDAITSSKELIKDFKGITATYGWKKEQAILNDAQMNINSLDTKYRKIFKSFIDSSQISSSEINQLNKLMQEVLYSYRSVIDYCYSKLLPKVKQESSNAYIHSGESP